METTNSRCFISLIGIDGDLGFSELIAKPDQFLPFFLQSEAPTSSMTVQVLQSCGSLVVRSGTRKIELRSLRNGLIATEAEQREVPFDFAAWVRIVPDGRTFETD